MTETAELADYVLPASTQFEKAEATFFNFEFPENHFHLRPRLLPPPAGPLPEAEIHARLVRGARRARRGGPRAAARGRRARANRVCPGARSRSVMSDPRLAALAPVILYRTLPLAAERHARAPCSSGSALKLAMENGAVARARRLRGQSARGGATRSSTRCSQRPYGVVFASRRVERRERSRRSTPNGRSSSRSPISSTSSTCSRTAPVEAGDASFPFVLSAGERRSFTANTIIRDPAWRKKDADGALRIHPDDASGARRRSPAIACGSPPGATRWSSSSRSRTRCSRGHVSLPNGLGLGYPDGERAAVDRRRAERAHRERGSRPVRRHAVAQARAGARRARGGQSTPGT